VKAEVVLESGHQKVLALLENSGESLHRLLGRLTLDEHAPGDLIQELFIRLTGSNGFDRAENPVAYARRSAINLAFEWRRKQKNNPQVLQNENTLVSGEPSALENLIRTEDLHQVLDATARLSELARQVVVLRFIEQQTYDEIAEQLDKTPHHVRAECSKALKRLRALLIQEQPTN